MRWFFRVINAAYCIFSLFFERYSEEFYHRVAGEKTETIDSRGTFSYRGLPTSSLFSLKYLGHRLMGSMSLAIPKVFQPKDLAQFLPQALCFLHIFHAQPPKKHSRALWQGRSSQVLLRRFSLVSHSLAIG